MSYGSLKAFYPEEARLAAWSQWRPRWPLEQESALTTWAWSQLTLMQEATKARAAAIAGRMADPGDRFLFAARCRQKNLLAEWCRDRDLLRQVNSTALMQAVQAFEQNPSKEPPASAVKDAAFAVLGHPHDLAADYVMKLRGVDMPVESLELGDSSARDGSTFILVHRLRRPVR